jgi:hypothetical protein
MKLPVVAPLPLVVVPAVAPLKVVRTWVVRPVESKSKRLEVTPSREAAGPLVRLMVKKARLP